MTHVCPWPPCGQELEDDHRHVGHEEFAKDDAHAYVPHVAPDGILDVYRVARANVQEFQARLAAWDRAVRKRRLRHERGLEIGELSDEEVP